jgi:hypothetical protein
MHAATRPGKDRQPETVQFDDRCDEIETKADTGRVPVFFRTMETSGHRVAFAFLFGRCL